MPSHGTWYVSSAHARTSRNFNLIQANLPLTFHSDTFHASSLTLFQLASLVVAERDKGEDTNSWPLFLMIFVSAFFLLRFDVDREKQISCSQQKRNKAFPTNTRLQQLKTFSIRSQERQRERQRETETETEREREREKERENEQRNSQLDQPDAASRP